MDLDIQQHLPKDFNPNSKVWIYQASRLFLISEALEMEDMLNDFTAGWNSHGTPVKGFATLLFGRFIVLMADESATGVSGCSTDSSVRLIKAIEEKFNNNLFDRQMLAFIIKDKIEMLPLSQLKYAIDNKFITPNTLYFNNTISSKEQLEKEWIIPAGESWLKGRMIG
ncbi:MAG: hypothetical protein EOO13_09535 [Chitinophagaceae bacterium]|nr:MAG: hypothetical protein EOO13_09535 [Chitinophagaceae bacterium]